MKILFVHPGVLPVLKYGGTERFLFWHMKELVQKGHEVSLIGHPESRVSNHGIQLISHIEGDWRSLVPKNTDIIHLFFTPSFQLDHPLLVTIEGNGKSNEKFHRNTLFISKSHAALHGATEFIYNGIDLSEYPCSPKKTKNWSQFLFLAKAKWKVKNLKDCVQACKKTKKHLEIAGGRYFGFSSYIHSYGIVDQKKKIELLQKTDALLFPVRWSEPFGIAIVEAFAMGLPVIGSAYGSLPELITPEIGSICRTYKEFEAAIAGNENQFDPDLIRSCVETRFSIQKISEQYVQRYLQVMQGKLIQSKTPEYQGEQPAEELLPF